MKKIICLSAAASLIAALAIGAGAAGEEKIVLKSSDDTLAVGDTLTVTIAVENFENFNTAMFYDVEYDENYLQWTGGSWLLEGGTLSDYVRDSKVTENGEQGRSGVYYTDDSELSGTIDIATMEFTVLQESETAQSIGCSVIVKNDETEVVSGSAETEVTLGEEPEITGTITLKQATLQLESEVYVNLYSQVSGFEGIDLTENMGMLIWMNDDEYNEEDFVYGNENVVVSPGAFVNGSYYGTKSPGIAAKELGVERPMRVYVKTGADRYVYSKVTEYSPEKYALNRLKSSSDDIQLKKLVAAMLDFGAAAQIQFNYRTDDLANAAMISDYSQYRSEYAAEMLQAAVTGDAALVDTWTRDKTNCPSVIASFILEGIITNNFRVKFTDSIMSDIQEAKFLFWDKETYDNMVTNGIKFADSEPTLVCEGVLESGYYVGGYDRIAAKNLGDTLYMCMEVKTGNGETYRSGVISYNAHTYVKNKLNNENDPVLHALVKALTVYGDCAKNYFADRT